MDCAAILNTGSEVVTDVPKTLSNSRKLFKLHSYPKLAFMALLLDVILAPSFR